MSGSKTYTYNTNLETAPFRQIGFAMYPAILLADEAVHRVVVGERIEKALVVEGHAPLNLFAHRTPDLRAQA